MNDYVCWMWPKGVASSLTPFVDDENDPDEISFSTRLVCVCNKFLIFMNFHLLILSNIASIIMENNGKTSKAAIQKYLGNN